MEPLTPVDTQHLRQLATTYRRMVTIFGIGWLGMMMMNSATRQGGGDSSLLMIVGLVVGVTLAVHGYQVAEQLDLPVPPLWAIGMFVPLLNLVCLAVLSRKATTYCTSRGVRVGFLGPRLEDIEKLEQVAQARAVRSVAGG